MERCVSFYLCFDMIIQFVYSYNAMVRFHICFKVIFQYLISDNMQYASYLFKHQIIQSISWQNTVICFNLCFPIIIQSISLKCKLFIRFPRLDVLVKMIQWFWHILLQSLHWHMDSFVTLSLNLYKNLRIFYFCFTGCPIYFALNSMLT